MPVSPPTSGQQVTAAAATFTLPPELDLWHPRRY
jgi:hypothetical protein